MKKRWLSLAVACSVAAGASFCTASYKDTGCKAVYASSELEQLKELGIVDGFEDGLLHPEKTLTRAQFAKILDTAFPDSTDCKVPSEYSDLDKTHWAYKCIERCSMRGWLCGFPDGTFRPDDEITYEQALAVVGRVIGLANYSGVYPEGAVSAAVDCSISDGVNALIGEKINRGQAGKILINALNCKDAFISGGNYALFNGMASGGMGKGSSVASMSGIMAPAATDSLVGEEAYSSMTDDIEAPIIVPSPHIPYLNSEEYTSNDENIFKDPLVSPLSTFSIDTDTASYSNMRRFILNGQNIPKGAVRIEELINYFDYSKAETDENTPFGVDYTLGRCPWNENNLLAMLTVSGEELSEPKPSNLVFLIDTSGSMYSYKKLPLVKQSLSLLLEKLGENDTVSIVTYASGTGVALEPTRVSDKDKIMKAINSLSPGGATAGASGINLAYEQAEKFKIDGNNRIILCTDGDFNIGASSSADLEELICQKRESGIFLSVLGFGMGNYKDSKMEILADKGNGNYAYIDNLREAKKVLADEMPKKIYTIAKDVKIQVEFNPAEVSKYRLVGYENRSLNAEDFENDKKDAGELGAGATVTVLYEIVPRSGDAVSPLKYQDAVIEGKGELMTLKLRYKEPDDNESILREYPLSAEVSENVGDDFNFASAVAELGMIINNSQYKGTSTVDSVIELARDSLGEDKFGIRCEFLQLADLLGYKTENRIE